MPKCISRSMSAQSHPKLTANYPPISPPSGRASALSLTLLFAGEKGRTPLSGAARQQALIVARFPRVAMLSPVGGEPRGRASSLSLPVGRGAPKGRRGVRRDAQSHTFVISTERSERRDPTAHASKLSDPSASLGMTSGRLRRCVFGRAALLPGFGAYSSSISILLRISRCFSVSISRLLAPL